MNNLSIEQAQSILTEQFNVSEETIRVVTDINGYTVEQMENILYAVSGYQSFDQLD